MAWNGSGQFTRSDGTRSGATVWDQARQASVTVNSADHDAHDEDLATGLENCLTRDGQNSPSANLPMGNRKHTGAAAATANGEYVTFEQLSGAGTPFVAAAGVGGTANAITLAPTSAITSHTTGQGFRFFVEAANTGAVTLAVSALAAVSLRRADGTAFQGGELAVGMAVTCYYNGSQYVTNVEGSSSRYNFWTGTQTEYDALSSYSNTTLYLISG